MQITVTDPVTNITTIEEIERIQVFLETEDSRAEVFFNKTLLNASGKEISKSWTNQALVLDLANPKIIQALQLFREVIEVEEKQRLTIFQSKSEILPLQALPIPSPSPSGTPVPTRTPPHKNS